MFFCVPEVTWRGRAQCRTVWSNRMYEGAILAWFKASLDLFDCFASAAPLTHLGVERNQPGEAFTEGERSCTAENMCSWNIYLIQIGLCFYYLFQLSHRDIFSFLQLRSCIHFNKCGLFRKSLAHRYPSTSLICVFLHLFSFYMLKSFVQVLLKCIVFFLSHWLLHQPFNINVKFKVKLLKS